MMGRGALAGTRLASERRKRIKSLKLQKQGTRKIRLFSPKPPQIMVIKGRINFLSLNTICVVVGFCIFAIGVVMCMFAYEYVGFPVHNNNNSSRTTDRDTDLSFPTERDSLRSIRLVGPLTVGFGVFVMLCGITALLEDRDRRTKRIIVRVPTDEVDQDLLKDLGPISPTVSGKENTFSAQEHRPATVFSNYRLPRFTVGSCPSLRYKPDDSPAHLNPVRGYMKSMPSPVPLRDLYRFQPLQCTGDAHDFLP